MSKGHENLDIYFLHILSEVQSRFATTEIASRIANRSDKPEETVFVANLPNAAFITYFEMEVDGKVIVGEIKEKEKAKETYEAAKFRGETAGHIAQKPRETNKFEISVNIKGGEEAKFKFVYQELLHRVRGVYKHQVNVQPGQFVSDLQVDVHIVEKLPFRVIHVPKFAPKLDEKSNQQLLNYNKAEEDVTLETSREDGISKASIQWRPSIESQQKLGILDGQLVVLYDVEREEDTGEIQVVDGYFVHYFAPRNLEVGNKNIIFALDTSGSMSGSKMNQTKEAMTMILSQLRIEDQFNVVSFETSCQAWKTSCVNATEQNVKEARNWVTALHANGGTNIDGAIQEGISKLKEASGSHSLDDLLILLTDGEHNSGGVGRNAIASRALQSVKANNKSVKIYGLGFGAEADFSLLKEISSKTGGIARRIYADSDAALQLRSFYEEISSPMLANVSIKYLNPDIDTDSIVRSSDGDTFYDGSEMVYAGKLIQNMELESLETSIRGRSANGEYQRSQPIRNAGPFPDLIPGMDLPQEGKDEKISRSVGSMVERSWAYLTIKNLLEKSETETDTTVAEKMKKDALDLSLKYGFVTAVTSMVAVQPQEGEEKTKQLLADEDQTVGPDLFSAQCGFMDVPVSMRGGGGPGSVMRGGGGGGPGSVMRGGGGGGPGSVMRGGGGPGSVMRGGGGSGYLLSKSMCSSNLSFDSDETACFAYSPHKGEAKKSKSFLPSFSFDGIFRKSSEEKRRTLGTFGRKMKKSKSEESRCKSASMLLERSPEEIAHEFNRQVKDFDRTKTLLYTLRNTDSETATAAVDKLISQTDKLPQNPEIQTSIEKLKRGEQPSESDWVVCCLVVGNFSEDDVKDVCDSVLDYQSDSVSVGTAVTFHVEQNGGYLVLKLKGNSLKDTPGGSAKSLDVKSQSLFDALEVMYQLTKICAYFSIAHGVEQLLRLVFEFPEGCLNQAGQKIREAIHK